MKTDVLIVGAGLGGLAAAARLARAGFRVKVVEKENAVGGRCGRLQDGPFRWDIGPTILLFPEVLRDHFRACGEDPAQSLDLLPCDPNYRIHFPGGSSLTMTANLRAMQAELERLAPGSFRGFLSFLGEARKAKDIAFSTFLHRTFDKPWEMASPEALAGILRSRSYRSLYSVVASHVTDERVRMALTFQTMYLGLSPLEGPALFGLLPYTELVDGVWYARGGLSAIAEALRGLAERCGATIELGRAARRFELAPGGTRVSAVTFEDGHREEARVVLANCDLPYAYRALLGRPLRRARLRYTSSGYMLFLACDAQWDTVLHHNVLFGANYVLVPVPHLDPEGAATRGPDWRDVSFRNRLKEKVLARIEATIAPGLRQAIRREHEMTPLDWQARFSLEHGSAFGLSHTLHQVGAFRPPNRDPEIQNLYFVGASTQPATGIPNVLRGAEHVARRITEEQRG
jgi:phytoene desaturase